MNIVLLGSTGSIGTQTLDVARRHGIKILALAANSSTELLEKQAREFKPKFVCVADNGYRCDLIKRLNDTNINLNLNLREIAELKCDMVVNAIVGMAGLDSTLAAIKAKNKIALANKESLVAGGERVMWDARINNVEIIPVDSEHSAIFQCLSGHNKNDISKIILTASGGAFYGYSKEMLKNVTKEQALHNPNWNMGNKVTVDSATLMNKGLEFIEAVRLFDVKPEQIEVVIHRQSILHSAVEFKDGSVIAQLGVPDMKMPIQYALTYPKRYESDVKKLSLTEHGTLTFEKPDEETFPLLAIARKAAQKGDNACAILNAANEAAVEAFLNDRIKFHEISEIVTDTYKNVQPCQALNLPGIYESAKKAQKYVAGAINNRPQ
jgi:1-deoxy-D-xylulose-5-phosphate reductoisomerase